MTRSVADTRLAGTAVIAVGGHESAYGSALAPLLGHRIAVAAPGRDLRRRVTRLLGLGADRVCVVPMTAGRDENLVRDTAATLVGPDPEGREPALLAEPFGTAAHAVGWLRTAALAAPADAALLIAGTAGTPDDDAELFRIARLVRQFGRHRLVEPALLGGDPDPAEGVRRCRLLGADRVAVLAAGFVLPDLPGRSHRADLPAPPGDPAAEQPFGAAVPLLSRAAVATVLAARVADAVRRFADSGDTGIAGGLSGGHTHTHAHPPAHDGHRHEDTRTHAHPDPPGPGHARDRRPPERSRGPATAPAPLPTPSLS